MLSARAIDGDIAISAAAIFSTLAVSWQYELDAAAVGVGVVPCELEHRADGRVPLGSAQCECGTRRQKERS